MGCEWGGREGDVLGWTAAGDGGHADAIATWASAAGPPLRIRFNEKQRIQTFFRALQPSARSESSRSVTLEELCGVQRAGLAMLALLSATAEAFTQSSGQLTHLAECIAPYICIV